MKKNITEKRNFISDEMIKKCKNDISKFGFTEKEYIQFLISVCAMKDENTVLKYSNSEMNEYHKMFLEKNEVDPDNDIFILNNFKITISDVNGNEYETGYFCPRSFWDRILKTKTN